MKANENLRTDTATREWVAEQIQEKQEAIRKAQKLLSQAQATLTLIPLYDIDDPSYRRVVESVYSACCEIARLEQSVYMNPPTEELIGNKSAFLLGETINKHWDTVNRSRSI